MKWFLKILGFTCVGLGFLGIFLPLLPTTPFLLLALFLFARSSPAWRQWLLDNKMFGPYLASYLSGQGISRRLKIKVLSILWITTLVTSIFFISNIYIRIGLMVISVCVTIHIINRKGIRKD